MNALRLVLKWCWHLPFSAVSSIFWPNTPVGSLSLMSTSQNTQCARWSIGLKPQINVLRSYSIFFCRYRMEMFYLVICNLFKCMSWGNSIKWNLSCLYLLFLLRSSVRLLWCIFEGPPLVNTAIPRPRPPSGIRVLY